MRANENNTCLCDIFFAINAEGTATEPRGRGLLLAAATHSCGSRIAMWGRGTTLTSARGGGKTHPCQMHTQRVVVGESRESAWQ